MNSKIDNEKLYFISTRIQNLKSLKSFSSLTVKTYLIEYLIYQLRIFNGISEANVNDSTISIYLYLANLYRTSKSLCLVNPILTDFTSIFISPPYLSNMFMKYEESNQFFNDTKPLILSETNKMIPKEYFNSSIPNAQYSCIFEKHYFPKILETLELFNSDSIYFNKVYLYISKLLGNQSIHLKLHKLLFKAYFISRLSLLSNSLNLINSLTFKFPVNIYTTDPASPLLRMITQVNEILSLSIYQIGAYSQKELFTEYIFDEVINSKLKIHTYSSDLNKNLISFGFNVNLTNLTIEKLSKESVRVNTNPNKKILFLGTNTSNSSISSKVFIYYIYLVILLYLKFNLNLNIVIKPHPLSKGFDYFILRIFAFLNQLGFIHSNYPAERYIIDNYSNLNSVFSCSSSSLSPVDSKMIHYDYSIYIVKFTSTIGFKKKFIQLFSTFRSITNLIKE